MNKPLVSICCLAYNHEKYISECLDGFLMQKVDFDFEILIHDDASTDNTAEIIKIYQTKYPEIIKPIYQKENQYSKGVSPTFKYNFPRSKGKYIAMCEGDDYWTDPFKLQKQVDFLETHKDYIITSGGYISKHNGLKRNIIMESISGIEEETDAGFTFNLESGGWLTKTLTAVFRNRSDIFKKLNQYTYSRDIHLFYHLLKEGKGYYHKEIFGLYNIHDGGVNSLKQGKVNILAFYNSQKEIYKFNKENITRKKALAGTLSYFNYELYNGDISRSYKTIFKLIKEAMMYIRDHKDVKMMMTSLLPESLKKKIR